MWSSPTAPFWALPRYRVEFRRGDGDADVGVGQTDRDFRRRMRFVPWLRLLAVAVVLSAGACSNPTETSSTHISPTDISAHRARWSTHRLTKYAYDYKVTGFLISYAGHDIHLVILNGVVQSATDLVTGQAAPGDAANWPTIDKLFDEAMQAAGDGSLRDAKFDPTLDFPTELDLAGPPDASGSIFASRLLLLP